MVLPNTINVVSVELLPEDMAKVQQAATAMQLTVQDFLLAAGIEKATRINAIPTPPPDRLSINHYVGDNDGA